MTFYKFSFVISLMAASFAMILIALCKWQGAAIMFINSVGWHWVWLYEKELR